MRTHSNWTIGLTLGALLTAAPNIARSATEDTRLLCSDGLDNDGDGNIDCDDNDCLPLTFCQRARSRAADEPASSVEMEEPRSRRPPARPQDKVFLTRVIVGSALLGAGVASVAASAAMWSGIRFTPASDDPNDTGFAACTRDTYNSTCASHAKDVGFLAGALVLDVVGITAAGVGGWLIGKALKPAPNGDAKTTLLPTTSVGSHSASVGLMGTF